MRTCSLCERTLPLNNFGKRTVTTYKGYCKTCQGLYNKYIHYPRYKDKQKYNSWKSILKSKYNLTPEDYDKMLLDQGSRCAICGTQDPKTANKATTRFAVDHCHKTGKVRGLLCDYCNVMLGRARDNKQVLQRAINYLNKGETNED